jgi:hypothetical protein
MTSLSDADGDKIVISHSVVVFFSDLACHQEIYDWPAVTEIWRSYGVLH